MQGLDIKNLNEINIDTLNDVLLRLLYNEFWSLLTEEEKERCRRERLSSSFWRCAYEDAAEYSYNQADSNGLSKYFKNPKMAAMEKLIEKCRDALWDYEVELEFM